MSIIDENELRVELRPHPEYDSIATYADNMAQHTQRLSDYSVNQKFVYAELAAAFRIIASWANREVQQ